MDVEVDTRKPNGFNWPMAIQVTREHGKLIYVAHATDRKCSLKEFRSGLKRLASNRIESKRIGSDRIECGAQYAIGLHDAVAMKVTATLGTLFLG